MLMTKLVVLILGFYQVFDAKFEKNISSEHHGAHIAKLSHSSTGNTNSVYIIKDNLTATPTINTWCNSCRKQQEQKDTFQAYHITTRLVHKLNYS